FMGGLLFLLPVLVWAAEPGQRERLFDDQWLFRRGEVRGAAQAAHNDSGWRSLDLPHDWSIEDLPPENPQYEVYSLNDGIWAFHEGDSKEWSLPDYADGVWQLVNLPHKWKDHGVASLGEPYGWYRRHLTIDESLKGKDLLVDLGTVMGSDETYF